MADTYTPDDLTTRRRQLIEAMSAVSEERTCAGWMADWARTIHAEGGIWETIGREVGWPTGNYDVWVWVSWDEAARLYGHTEAPEVRRCGHNDIVYGLCVRPIPHDGECFHERQPIRTDEETDEETLCNAEYPGDDNFVGQLCGLPKDHFGEHRCDEQMCGTSYTALLRWPNQEAGRA